MTLFNNFQPLANETESPISDFARLQTRVCIDIFHLILFHNSSCWLSIFTSSLYSYSMSLLMRSSPSTEGSLISVGIGSSKQCISLLDFHPQSVKLDNSTAAVSNLYQIQATVLALILKDNLARWEGWDGNRFFFLFHSEHKVEECIYRCFNTSIKNKYTLQVRKKSSHLNNCVTSTLKMFSQTDYL